MVQQTKMIQRLVRASLFICLSAFTCSVSAQTGYQEFIVGNPGDTKPSPNLSAGLVLMGGGTDVDAAFQWMCQRAGGGDFVVIRASGADGYNKYVQKLCPQMDSAESIVITSVDGANSDYVRDHIRNAEALWIAGGDQSKYVKLWSGTEVQKSVNYLLNTKRVPVGGTSAGLAVLSQFVYTGENGSAKSSDTLMNPFHSYVTIERDLFKSTQGAGLLYDSHFVSRDRLGRSLTFLAQVAKKGWTKKPRGIGVSDRTAILVLPGGSATVVGEGAVYFLQANGPAETFADNTPLTYLKIEAYKLKPGGTFDFSKWKGSRGVAYTLNVEKGVVTSTQSGGSLY